MAVRPILTWPDKGLSTACDPVGDVGDVARLIADLFDTMYAANGRGLAAPQIGAPLRVFVMDATWKDGETAPRALVNPVIMAVERVPVLMDEVCLSIPDLVVPVERPVAVTVQWTSETGEIHMDDFDGAEARIIQHEFDHLNGIVTLDRVQPKLRADLVRTYLPALG